MHLALILLYAVANLPIVVWLMHDFFANLPIELEESAQLDGATRFGIFWEMMLRPSGQRCASNVELYLRLRTVTGHLDIGLCRCNMGSQCTKIGIVSLCKGPYLLQ